MGFSFFFVCLEFWKTIICIGLVLLNYVFHVRLNKYYCNYFILSASAELNGCYKDSLKIFFFLVKFLFLILGWYFLFLGRGVYAKCNANAADNELVIPARELRAFGC